MSTYYLVEPPSTQSAPVDYSSVYNSIYNELANIDTDTTGLAATTILIAASLSTLANNSTILAEKLTAIETYHKKMKELGEAGGIHIRGPFEALSLISIYKLLVEQARVLDVEGSATSEIQSQAIVKAEEYITKLNENFKEF